MKDYTLIIHDILIVALITTAIIAVTYPFVDLREPMPEASDMRGELQHFVIRLESCNYIAYWTYSYNRSLRLIHAADCPNRDGHVFILSDGSITTRFGGKR